MKERPILFSSAMVRAILEDRKVQTRRVMKSQPYTLRTEGFGYPTKAGGFVSIQSPHCLAECPYGIPGDRLWCRETWASGYQNGAWGTICRADSAFIQGKRQHEKGPHFHAKEIGPHIRWRPSIFMPRWASRITLEITDVRVQRLQEISCADAIAEGIRPAANSMTIDCDTKSPRDGFRSLWDSINAKRGFGWDKSPWTWALTFRRQA